MADKILLIDQSKAMQKHWVFILNDRAEVLIFIAESRKC